VSEPDFLSRMAGLSQARARVARSRRPEAEMARLATQAAPAPPLRLGDFDIIAEVKRRSPAAGGLTDRRFDVGRQLAAYARGGACAVSVLTEPEEFRGSLEQLAEAATLLAEHRLPVMRKDFLADPYQVLEARAAGAGGILLIVKMLADSQLGELCSCADEYGLFVLLEAFDDADLERIAALPLDRHSAPVLAGVNCRNLTSLRVSFARFDQLAGALPGDVPVVAESGIMGPDQVRHVAGLGYRLALVGSALMSASDPAEALSAMVAAGREAAPR
jgi:indole-3-glycerol phosphate synthase